MIPQQKRETGDQAIAFTTWNSVLGLLATILVAVIVAIAQEHPDSTLHGVLWNRWFLAFVLFLFCAFCFLIARQHVFINRAAWRCFNILFPRAPGITGRLNGAPFGEAQKDIVSSELPTNAGYLAGEQHTDSGTRRVGVCFVDVCILAGTPAYVFETVLGCCEEAVNEALQNILENVRGDSEFQRRLLAFAVPASNKSSRNGIEVVWEFPQEGCETKVGMGLGILILDFICNLQTGFDSALAKAALRPFAHYLRHSGIRAGLSYGDAWKRLSRIDGGIIFNGDPIEEAYQLSQIAKPMGLVANIYFAPYLFMERSCAGQGGFSWKECGRTIVPIWVTDDRLWRRRPKSRALLSSVRAAMEWMSFPYDARRASSFEKLSLTEDDVICVFDIRKELEPAFAAQLAAHLRDHPTELKAKLLAPIYDIVAKMESLLGRAHLGEDPEWKSLGASFHERIAELSDGNNGSDRREFTRRIYEFTSPVYGYAVSDPGSDPKNDPSKLSQP
jgi:hypothetical protein